MSINDEVVSVETEETFNLTLNKTRRKDGLYLYFINVVFVGNNAVSEKLQTYVVSNIRMLTDMPFAVSNPMAVSKMLATMFLSPIVKTVSSISRVSLEQLVDDIGDLSGKSKIIDQKTIVNTDDLVVTVLPMSGIDKLKDVLLITEDKHGNRVIYDAHYSDGQSSSEDGIGPHKPGWYYLDIKAGIHDLVPGKHVGWLPRPEIR